MKIIEHQTLYITFVGLAAAFAGLMIGYNTTVIAGALVFLSQHYELSTFHKELIAAAILIGALMGAISSGYLTHKWGPKRCLISASLITIVFSGACALAANPYSIILFRLLLGLGIGQASMVAPYFIGESSPSRWRGMLVTLIQLFITLGILISYVTGYLFAESDNWRAMFVIATIPAILLLATVLLLPNSPRWLISRGFTAAGMAILKLIEPESAHLQQASPQLDAQPSLRWSQLFTPTIRPVLFMSAGLFVLQNISGIDGVLFYAPEIFRIVGLGSDNSQMLATVSLGVFNFLATIIAIIFVDRLGRRPLLLTGLLLMALSLGILAFSLYIGADSDILHIIAIINLTIYIATFAISLGPLPYVIMAEVFPNEIRSRAMASVAATSWTLNLLVTITFLSLIEIMGEAGLFWLYSGICALGFLLCLRFVPETKGCSLEDIEKNVAAGKPLRQIGNHS